MAEKDVFQPLKYGYFLLFSVLHHNQFNIFGIDI